MAELSDEDARGRAVALYNQGVGWQEVGRIAEAKGAYAGALALAADLAEAWFNLGVIAAAEGDRERALAHWRRAAELAPGWGEAQVALGQALFEGRDFEEAARAFEAAATAAPADATAWYDAGNAWWMAGDASRAAAAYRGAIARRAEFPEAHYNLGNVLRTGKDPDGAIGAFDAALAYRPGFVHALNGRACAALDRGEAAAAVDGLRRALAADPGHVITHSNLLFALHFDRRVDARGLLAEHLEWARRHEAPQARQRTGHDNDRTPGRRLRVGYVVADLPGPLLRFLWPLLASHDAAAVEVFCYVIVQRGAMAETLRKAAHQWREIAGMGDEAVAALVRRDRIDVLVDLSAHSGGGRLLVFARKPAPVQVTYLAYCSTTGLGAMDYRLSDRTLDPEGGDLKCYREATKWVDSYWCYWPPDETPEVGDLPACRAGAAGVTFGCLNQLSKVKDEVLAVWGRVLARVAGSRLVIHAPEGAARERVWAALVRAGVGAQRCTFVGFLPVREYLEKYREIDVALDPFPYAGGTTTCDALWMGVPVVTLRGATAVGRGGVSILSQVGLEGLVAGTEEQYVGIAAGLAGDLARLGALRAGLRGRMRASPLMDGVRLARGVEAAYREMWRAWCAG